MKDIQANRHIEDLAWKQVHALGSLRRDADTFSVAGPIESGAIVRPPVSIALAKVPAHLCFLGSELQNQGLAIHEVLWLPWICNRQRARGCSGRKGASGRTQRGPR